MQKSGFPTYDALKAAAWMLNCDVAAIQAVAEVEAGSQGAFLKTGEPTILYERHIFHRLTNGAFDGARASGITGPNALLSSASAGGYGPVSVQHTKLAAATKLDREAALRSCSWGLFQILGVNHARAGFPRMQRFINAMYREVDDHLRAFVMFIRYDAELVDAIRTHSWATFARLYNGPAYARNRYDHKLAEAFTRFDK